MSIWFVLIPIIVMCYMFMDAMPKGQKIVGLAPLFIGIACALGVLLYMFGGIAFDEMRRGTSFGWILLALDAFVVWLIYIFVRMAVVCIE